MIDLDMPVLGHVSLRDVHVRHDFDARDQARMKRLGRRRLFLQQPVNAVAQLDLLLERNDMDVTGALANGFGNDQVDQVDDRRLVGHHLDIVQVPSFNAGACSRVEILDHLLNRDLVALGHLLEDLRHRHDRFPHLQPAH